MTWTVYLGACTYARIEKLMCTAHSSALHKRILQSNIFKKKDDHNQRNTISNKTSIFPRRPLTKLRRPQPKNLNNLNQKFKMTSPKKKLRWPHPKMKMNTPNKWRWTQKRRIRPSPKFKSLVMTITFYYFSLNQFI